MQVAPYRPDADWAPHMRLKVYLENVGAAAMGRMISTATFVPVAGYVTGDVEFVLRDREVVDCTTNLQMRDVKFAVNEGAALRAGLKPELLTAQLARVTGSGRVVEDCNGSLLDPGYRTMHVVQAGMTRETMKSAPPMLRALALGDVKTLTGDVTGEALRDVGGDLGDAVATSLLGTPSTAKPTAARTSDNVAKKSWRGIKKVFGQYAAQESPANGGRRRDDVRFPGTHDRARRNRRRRTLAWPTGGPVLDCRVSGPRGDGPGLPGH